MNSLILYGKTISVNQVAERVVEFVKKGNRLDKAITKTKHSFSMQKFREINHFKKQHIGTLENKIKLKKLEEEANKNKLFIIYNIFEIEDIVRETLSIEKSCYPH